MGPKFQMLNYGLGAQTRCPTNNFNLKSSLFGATNKVKNSDKKKWVCSGYGITFDGEGLWNFDNDFAKNIVIFGVGKSSSYHPDNRKNNFLVLGEGLAYVINRTLVSPGKMFGINFSKADTKFCLILHYNGDNSYWFVDGKEIFKFKADNKNVD